MTNPISVLCIGDIVGRSGRHCLETLLPRLKSSIKPDIIVGNGENIAGGFGITEKLFLQMTDHFGFDVLTTGNHWADKKEIYEFGSKYKNLLLPANMYNVKDYRRGYFLGKTKSKIPYAVINLTGDVFMKGDNLNPFHCADHILSEIEEHTKVIVVDLHAEVSSEKQALGHYLANRVSLLYGTHTHCPTADERILNAHTGYLTDIGMTGAYDSVIGMKKEISIETFVSGIRQRFEPASSDPWLCAVSVKIEPATGKCLEIQRHRLILDQS